MRFFLSLFLILVFARPIVYCQSWYNVGAVRSSMGGCSVANRDVFSIWNNQSGIDFCDKVCVVISYENRFMLSELSTKNIGVIYPSDYGNLALSISDYGSKNYNEKEIALSYGRLFNNGLAVGFGIDFIHHRLGLEYGKSSSLTIEAGLTYNIRDDLILGCHIFNPAMTSLSKEIHENLPSYYEIGLRFLASKDFNICVEMQKDIRYKPQISTGVQYVILDKFYLRGGFSFKPLDTSFGIGYKLAETSIDIAFQNHPQLGISSSVSISHQF